MSRQREWQKKMNLKKLCIICARPSITSHHCEIHAEYRRIKSLEKYRNKVGIPLDAPLHKGGKPRMFERVKP